MTDAGLIPPLVLSTSHQQAEDLGAGEQFQEALKFASMGGGGVEVEGKSAWASPVFVDSCSGSLLINNTAF